MDKTEGRELHPKIQADGDEYAWMDPERPLLRNTDGGKSESHLERISQTCPIGEDLASAP